MNYVGIDISKLFFDVAIEVEGRYRYWKLSNDRDGFKQLLQLIKGGEYWCVMEASGPYYLKLACYLNAQEISLSVVNPLVIRRFCQMRLVKAKTDKKDASMIAEYGKTEKPKKWKEQEGYMLELRQLQAYLEQLDKSRTGYIRQMEAFVQSPVLSKKVKAGLTKMIKGAEGEIKRIEQEMQSIIERYHQDMYSRVKSIPGIGKKTSMLLVVITSGFTMFENAKQLSSYVGLSPRIFESGTSVKGKVKICKMGMSRIRAMLYLCSWSAIKCNKACKELYTRLVDKGKPKMVALIAVANKLIKQSFAIATTGSVYQENYLPKACF
jgi:transposase